MITIDFDRKYFDQNQVIFRIKEVNKKYWYYQNKYKSSDFFYHSPFPFGFPIIKDSLGKQYLFEIIPQNNQSDLLLKINNKSIGIKYKYNKSELLSDKNLFIKFIIKKIIISFSISNFGKMINFIIIPIVILFFGFQVFLSSLSSLHKLKIASRITRFSFSLILLIFIFDTFINDAYDNRFFPIILFLWLINFFYIKMTSKHSFMVFSILLILSIYFDFQSAIKIAEKISIWAYLFLVVGTIQTIIELKLNPRQLI